MTTPTPTPTTVGLTAAEAESLSPNERATIAYTLYDEGKRSVDVAKVLYLSAEEAIRCYKEFWRLKHHDELYRIYPQIRHEIPYLLKFHKSLRKFNLTDSVDDIDYYVRMIDTVYTKLPHVEEELSDLQTEVENARNELQSIKQEKQKVLYEFQNQKRLLVNDIQSTKKNISDLKEAQGQIQQTFDFLIYRTTNLQSRAESLQ